MGLKKLKISKPLKTPNLIGPDISKLINDLEKEVRAQKPEVKWIYVEPNLQEWKSQA